MTDLPLFADRYRLLDPLTNTSSQRLRARDERLGRQVELRIFDLAPDTDEARRVLATAGQVARILHPSVCRVFDAGATATQVYVVSELVEGQTLAEWLASRLPPSRDQALALAIDLARGLAAAHATQIVHGGLSPDRVRIDREGRAHLGDFGEAADTLWLAPEVIAGSAPTASSDVYALGALLHQLATGQPPNAQADAGRLAPGLSESLRSLMGRMLASNPVYRPPAATVVEEAQAILDRAAEATRPLGEIRDWRLGTGREEEREGKEGKGEEEAGAVVQPPLSVAPPSPQSWGERGGQGRGEGLPSARRRWLLPLVLIGLAVAAGLALLTLRPFSLLPVAPTAPVVAATTAVPTLVPFLLQGRVDVIDGTRWTVEGQVVEVPFSVSNNPRSGVTARIEGGIRPDGTWVARVLTWIP